jgi:hypothetical protein
MKRLIRKILREEIEKSDKHYRILDKISNYVEIPYFKSMEGLTIYDEDDQEYIMKKILGVDIDIPFDDGMIDHHIFDDKGNLLYFENYDDGDWAKYEYDDKGDRIYREDSDGDWVKYEYDDKGNVIYSEDSFGDIWDNR